MVWAQLSVKKEILTFSWDMKGLIFIGFLGKEATVNSDSYSQTFRRYSTYLLHDPRLLLLECRRYKIKHYQQLCQGA